MGFLYPLLMVYADPLLQDEVFVDIIPCLCNGCPPKINVLLSFPLGFLSFQQDILAMCLDGQLYLLFTFTRIFF